MSHINLLPWREKQREKHKQLYVALLGLLSAATVGLVMAGGSFLDSMIAAQKARNQFLEKENAILDVRIGQIATVKEQKKNIEMKISLIQQLQQHRNVSPKVLNELANIVPPGVTFRKFTRKENQIEIIGISDSNNRLADFMRRLESSDTFIDGELSSIVADTSTTEGVSDFKLTFNVSPQVAPSLVSLEEEEKAK